jgi:hypothetical protein
MGTEEALALSAGACIYVGATQLLPMAERAQAFRFGRNSRRAF